jgi:hypothetical protein
MKIRDSRGIKKNCKPFELKIKLSQGNVNTDDD